MRRMITGKDAEIFKNIAADGTKTVVSGDLDVGGFITQNGGDPVGGGTKLYKHYLHDSSINYKFILITTNPEPIDFSSIDVYSKLNDYLMSQNVIRFTDDSGNNIQYESTTDSCFYFIYSQGAAPSISLYDDWSLANTTDTVTEL